jgi:signal transduction histidine kinase
MDWVHNFLVSNRELIFFVYGLIFFVLGLAIVLQTRRSSRLELARSLRWLALFAFLHAFNEWGDLFIPIQSPHLRSGVIDILLAAQLLLLGASFAFLFEFGVVLLSQAGNARRLHALPAALMGIWLFISYFILLPAFSDLQAWHHTSSALARYFIAFPGALISAYALRHNTLARIAPLGVPAIVTNLRVAGISLFLYALLAGLIPPAVSFFPGNIINESSFEGWVGIPTMIFRSSVALVMAVTIIRALEIFEVETDRRIEELEQSSIISSERERLARELHDGALQKVYTAGLLVESAARLAAPGTPLASRLDRAVSALNDSIIDMRHNLAELHSERPHAGQDLEQSLEQLAADPHFNSLMSITFNGMLPSSHTLSPLRVEHVVAVAHEALSNVARHAHAQNVSITFENKEEELLVIIQDDGVGYEPESAAGYGLRNMRDRARLLGGELEINGIKGKGTKVILTIPWLDE